MTIRVFASQFSQRTAHSDERDAEYIRRALHSPEPEETRPLTSLTIAEIYKQKYADRRYRDSESQYRSANS